MATQSLRAVPSSQYQPKQFSRENKYIVDGFQYPSDLMGLTTDQTTGYSQANYGSNYVIFYINVNNESRMLENPDIQTVDIGSNERVAKQLAGRNFTQEQVVLAAGAEGAGLGALVGSGGGAGSAGGLLAGVGAASVMANTKNSTFSRPQKRLKTAIALHVPNQLSIRYGMGWGDEETFGKFR